MSESYGRTLGIVVTVALLCSAMVSLSVYYLRPIQLSAAAEQRMRAVLTVADRLPNDVEQQGTIYQALDARIFDFRRATIARAVGIDAHLFDHWDETQAPARSDASNDVGLSSLPQYAPVYVTFDGGEVERLVLPFHGRGMWSTIYGYIALAPDLRTVSALHIFNHGETPGIGDRILDPDWLGLWPGKLAYDEANPAIEVSDDTNLASHHRVDTISGATITSKAVGQIVRYWLGPDGYGPWIEELRSGRSSL